MRKTVYLSFPYRNDPVKNIKLINILINKISDIYKDYLFISPLHLFKWIRESNLNENDYDKDIMRFDLMMVDICDKVWVFDYTEQSTGCYFEEIEGHKENKKVRVFNKYELENFLGMRLDEVV